MGSLKPSFIMVVKHIVCYTELIDTINFQNTTIVKQRRCMFQIRGSINNPHSFLL